jgi:hypothetical protein
LTRQCLSTSRFGDLRSLWMMAGLWLCRYSMPLAASSICAARAGGDGWWAGGCRRYMARGSRPIARTREGYYGERVRVAEGKEGYARGRTANTTRGSLSRRRRGRAGRQAR